MSSLCLNSQPFPHNQCTWRQKTIRIFHFWHAKAGRFTGNFELTFENEFGETWECNEGWYSHDAERAEVDVRYTDIEVPENQEIAMIYYSFAWDSEIDPESQ